MPVLRVLLVLTMVIVVGVLGAILAFSPDRFRAWASNRLDKNKSTEEARFEPTPQPSIWDASKTPNWYYQVFGSIMLLVSLFLISSFIIAAIKGFPE